MLLSLACMGFGVSVAAAGQTISPPNAERGQRLFLRCSICHSLEESRPTGPALAHVVGRRAGTEPGFRYSIALARSGIIWDEQSLDAFLAAPREMVPGTRMGIGVSAARDRADIIAYLSSDIRPAEQVPKNRHR